MKKQSEQTEGPSIFDFVNQVQNGNSKYYQSLKQVDQKAFVPMIVMMWLYGAGTEFNKLMINEFVNSKCFSLYEHPNLLYKLMCACHPDKTNKRAKWVFPKKQKESDLLEMLKQYYNCNTEVAKEYSKILTVDQIKQIKDDIGLD